MNYHIKSLCHKGPIREKNEDAISYGKHPKTNAVWMLVADGMGGRNAGEIASSMLVEQIKSAWDSTVKTPQLNWLTWIIEQFTTANTKIFNQAKSTINQEGMGTTGVLIVIENNICHLGWVGDSRAYTLKNKSLRQQTTDHTVQPTLREKGDIGTKKVMKHKKHNILSQAIGVSENILVDTTSITMEHGDTIMLSTDGLHDFLTEFEMTDYLSDCVSKDKVCEAMIDHAINNNSRDNLTIGLVTIVS